MAAFASQVKVVFHTRTPHSVYGGNVSLKLVELLISSHCTAGATKETLYSQTPHGLSGAMYVPAMSTWDTNENVFPLGLP